MKKLIISYLLILFVIGCSDNSTTTNPTTPPSGTTNVILFTKDSLFVNATTNNIDSTSYFCNLLIDTLRVEFEAYSYHMDGYMDFQLNQNLIVHYLVSSQCFGCDSSFALKLPLSQSQFNNHLLVYNGGNPQGCYASLKNIKIWYIKKN